MPKFVIEREVPGAGQLSPEQLQAISVKSVGVLRDLGPEIQWVNSYVLDEKIYCVFNAPSKELIEEHARCGDFPVTSIHPVRAIIDPITAE